MIVYRNTDVDVPFFWESDGQPAARWHGEGEGPVQYASSNPSAAWAEFLRHAGITDPADLAGVERAIWVIEIPDDEPTGSPALPIGTLTGDERSYRACQAEARRLRDGGSTRLIAPSAAVLLGTPSGWRTDGELQRGPPADQYTIVLFGKRPDVTGWIASAPGRPEPEIVERVRFLSSEHRAG
ncbi:MAG: RES family NAD+ phosphorylase [Chloroflexota bacterium]|nr:RES family NAD+ phosphorylase [Chloroflexota bacterium]